MCGGTTSAGYRHAYGPASLQRLGRGSKLSRRACELQRQAGLWYYPCPEVVARSAAVDEAVLWRGELVVWVQIPLRQDRGLDPGTSYPERALLLLVFCSSLAPQLPPAREWCLSQPHPSGFC